VPYYYCGSTPPLQICSNRSTGLSIEINVKVAVRQTRKNSHKELHRTGHHKNKCKTQPAGAAHSTTWNADPETTVLFWGKGIKRRKLSMDLGIPISCSNNSGLRNKYSVLERTNLSFGITIAMYNCPCRHFVSALPASYSSARDDPQFAIKFLGI